MKGTAVKLTASVKAAAKSASTMKAAPSPAAGQGNTRPDGQCRAYE